MKVGTKVQLAFGTERAVGEIIGHLDEMVRVRWEDGICGIYSPADLDYA